MACISKNTVSYLTCDYAGQWWRNGGSIPHYQGLAWHLLCSILFFFCWFFTDYKVCWFLLV